MGRVWQKAFEAGLTGLCLMSVTAQASPWGRDPEEHFGVTKFDYFISEDDDRRFEQLSFETYAETGFDGKWSQGSKFINVWQNVEDELTSDNRSGLAEAEFFVQRQVWETGTQQGALQLLYSFQTSKRSALLGQDTDDRDAAIELSGLWGVGNEIAFLSTKAGYRASLGKDADQLRLDVTAGFHADENNMLLVDVYTRLATGSPETDGAEFDLVTLSPSIVSRISPHLRVQIGVRTDIHAVGLDKGTAGFLALWFER